MARARNIKPGFFRNADLVELPVETRLLFIGLWSIADREGRLDDRPKQIKMELYPADSFDVDAMLTQLSGAGFIERYAVNEIKYIQIVNFAKHQNPHRDEKASTIPAPCKHDANSVQNGLIPESLLLNPEPLKLKPEPRIKPKAPAAPLPDWLQPEAWEDFLQHRKSLNSKMTPRAQALALTELTKLRAEGHDPTEVIKQSIMRGWKGLFALNTQTQTKGQSRHEYLADKIADLTGRNKRPASNPEFIHGTAERVD